MSRDEGCYHDIETGMIWKSRGGLKTPGVDEMDVFLNDPRWKAIATVAEDSSNLWRSSPGNPSFAEMMDAMHSRCEEDNKAADEYSRKWPKRFRWHGRELYLTYGPHVADNILRMIRRSWHRRLWRWICDRVKHILRRGGR